MIWAHVYLTEIVMHGLGAHVYLTEIVMHGLGAHVYLTEIVMHDLGSCLPDRNRDAWFGLMFT